MRHLGDEPTTFNLVRCKRRAGNGGDVIATDTFANPAQQYRDSAAYLGGGFPRRVSNLRVLPPGLLLVMLQFPPAAHNPTHISCVLFLLGRRTPSLLYILKYAVAPNSERCALG